MFTDKSATVEFPVRVLVSIVEALCVAKGALQTVCPDVFGDRGPNALAAVMFIFAMLLRLLPAALRFTFGATHNTYALLTSVVASRVHCCLVLLLLTVPTVVVDLGKQTL